MEIAHHLTTIGSISSVATSYWVKNLHLWCIKACMKLNDTESLIEMEWKNFERERKSFGTVLKIWQKNTCGRAAFLETSQAGIIFQKFPCILRKWVILQGTFHRHIQQMHFLCDLTDFQKQSVQVRCWGNL